MTSLLNFGPAEIVVQVGDMVEWRNTSVFYHTVTADESLARNPDLVEVPAGAEKFHSGRIQAGEVFRHEFTVPGTYRYVCLPHERMGMAGVVIVEARP